MVSRYEVGSVARRLGVSLVAMIALAASGALAGVATDGTVGPRRTLAGPNFEIGAGLGTRAGGNLFHSFERFALDRGESATFSGPGDVQNVVGRVTGGTPSAIDGTLRSTIPGADLYLINPAGVIFGPHAALEVQGSFHVSTADELRFADGVRFSARDPATSSLTVAAPEAFGFLDAEPGKILINRSRLEVPSDHNLSLVGGEITIDGGNAGTASVGQQGRIGAKAGTITMAALEGPGEVRVADARVDAAGLADVTLTDGARVDTSGDGGGAILIRAGALQLFDSEIIGDNLGAFDAAGSIDIRTNSMLLDTGSRIALDARSSGDAGAIRISADTLTLERNSIVASAAFAGGDAGEIVIDAEDLSIVGTIGSDDITGIIASGQSASSGAAGNTTVRARGVVIRDDGLIGSDAFGGGRAGDVNLSARSLDLRDGGAIRAVTFTDAPGGIVSVDVDRLTIAGNRGSDFTTIAASSIGGSGSAGTVTINAQDSFLIEKGGSIQSITGDGQGGAVRVRAGQLLIRGIPVQNSHEIIGTGITTVSFGAGDAGSIAVMANTTTVEEEGAIRASTFGAGDAGVVSVRAAHIAVLSGGEISSDSETAADGAAGLIVLVADGELRVDGAASRSITRIGTDTMNGASGPRLFKVGDQLMIFDAGTVIISADRIEIADGGAVRSVTFGNADAGTIAIFAQELHATGDSAPTFTGVTTSASTLDSGGAGGAGNVLLSVRDIELRDGALIASESLGGGPAGSITIENAREVSLDGAAEISTSTGVAGGGDIDIAARDLILLRDGSRIGVDVLVGGARAGDIKIDPSFLILDRSDIGATADGGAGGQIDITADILILSPDSDITARAGPAGIDGTVVIGTRVVDLTGSLVTIEVPLLDAAGLLRERCASRRDIGSSSFTGIGRGGLPPGPDRPLPSDYRSHPPSDSEPGRANGSDAARIRVAAGGGRRASAPVLLVRPCAGAP